MDTWGSNSEDSLMTMENTELTSNVCAKLRRLKIQESIITASLKKCNLDQDDYATDDLHQIPNWKSYSVKVKNNICEIKNMFEDIKIATNDSEDNIKNINIEDIKKDVLNLNSKIQSLEEFINKELVSLKLEEKELIRQMNEEPKPEVNTKEKFKIQKKLYNDVVPSPVRVLINSPLKCKEVQQFQAFMSRSKNRYGGWNEYNHNIFIQIWKKYYATDNIENIMNEINHSKLLPQFTDEICEKIPGIQLDDIISHCKWYSEFCYLKNAQQVAVEKWRDNKRKIKGRQGKVKTLQVSSDEKLGRKDDNSNKSQKKGFRGHPEDHEYEKNQSSFESNDKSLDSSTKTKKESFTITRQIPNPGLKLKSRTFATPTEQWINRCKDGESLEVTRYFNSNIENIDKLCIPNWRLNLHNNRGFKENE